VRQIGRYLNILPDDPRRWLSPSLSLEPRYKEPRGRRSEVSATSTRLPPPAPPRPGESDRCPPLVAFIPRTQHDVVAYHSNDAVPASLANSPVEWPTPKGRAIDSTRNNIPRSRGKISTEMREHVATVATLVYASRRCHRFLPLSVLV